MAALRTIKKHQKYLKLIANGFLADECVLCKSASIKNFKHWRIIDNKFPYDRIAKVNHMIIPKRHIAERELNKMEKKEFESIKSGFIDKKYEFLIEGTNKNKSIPNHFHIHLIITKDRI